jgi:hypothetical protein
MVWPHGTQRNRDGGNDGENAGKQRFFVRQCGSLKEIVSGCKIRVGNGSSALLTLLGNVFKPQRKAFGKPRGVWEPVRRHRTKLLYERG